MPLLLPEEYRDILENPIVTPYEKFQVRRPVGRWETLEDVLSSGFTRKRDDDRQTGFTSLPPAATMTVTVNNPEGKYTFDEGTRFSDLLEPERRIRKFSGFRGEPRDLLNFFGPKNLFSPTTPNQVYQSLDDGHIAYGFAFEPTDRVMAAQEGRKENVDAADDRMGPLGVYGYGRYGAAVYGTNALYASMPIDTGVEDPEFDTPILKGITVEFDNGAGHTCYLLYRVATAPDAPYGAWVNAGAVTSGVEETMSVAGRMVEYALVWVVDYGAVNLPIINSVVVRSEVDRIEFPVFYGYLTRPVQNTKVDANQITFQSYDGFKKVLDQRSGAIHFQGTGESPAGADMDMSEVVREILTRAGFHSHDLVLDEVGVNFAVGAAGITLEPDTYRNHLAGAMQTCQRQGSKEQDFEIFNYILKFDAVGRWILERVIVTMIAHDVLSHAFRIDGDGITRAEDDTKIINQQTVIGAREPVTYPEEIVATQAVSFGIDDLEAIYDVTLTPSILGTSVTNIRFDNSNPHHINVFETEAIDETDPDNFSRSRTRIKIKAVNKDVHFLAPSATVKIYGTPVDPSNEYVGESVDLESQSELGDSGEPIVPRYGVRIGSEIKTVFVTSELVAQNLSKAIVRARANPQELVDLSFWTLMPHLELNVPYRVFEPRSNIHTIFVLIDYSENSRVSGGSVSMKAKAKLESLRIVEAAQTYDFSRSIVGIPRQETLWDSGRVWDQDIDEPETTPRYESVFA